MAVKNISLRISAVLFFILMSPSLWAQADAPGRRIYQRLSWVGNENVMRYEVIIEREEQGVYRGLLREFTEVSHINVSLQPGKYRFQVIPYDYLGHPDEGSGWMNIEVLPFQTARPQPPQSVPQPVPQPAPQPTPQPTPPPEPVPEPVPEPTPEPETYTQPASIIEPQSETKTTQESEREPAEKIAKPRIFDIYLEAAWMPVLPVYGENLFIGKDMSLSGAGVRLGMIYATKNSLFNPGVELAAAWHSGKTGTDNLSLNCLAADINLLARKWFPSERASVNLRFGGGLYYILDNLDKQKSDESQYSLNANIGLSFNWLLSKHFIVEAGLDYVHLFTEENSGCYRPWIGAGLQF